MKKLLLISVLLGIIILTGCSQQKWLSKSELFEKKQECSKYMGVVQKRETEKYFLDELGMSQHSNVTDVFYSPSLNTCVYAGNRITYYNYIDKDVINPSETKNLLFITDALTHKTIYSNYDRIEWERDYYNKKIKELKWE